jgi:Asp-tRNA(Asn)/Glu-tRNA(Gln) amidotransferase A subunit family amidase
LHARSIDDLEILSAVLRMQAPAPRKSVAPRIRLCRTDLWETAGIETKAAVEIAAQKLGAASATVCERELPDAFAGLHVIARETINHYERSACMAFLFDRHREQLSPQMRSVVENGQKTTREDYVAAWRRVEHCRALLPEVFDGFDVLLVPCVPGEAPEGLAKTGDPSMQAMWTALHTPTMTLPTHRGPHDLPVGIQLVAPRYEDERLFACARWMWEKIGSTEMIGCTV